MKLKTIYKIFVRVIVVIAYCVIIYKLATYNNYSTLFDQFVANISTNWVYLLLCLLLMPCNMLTESIKWQCAVWSIEKISFKKAIISTLRGQVGGIATPNKLGDIPTRALSLQDKNKASGIIMGFIAAWSLSAVIITIGATTVTKYISIYYPEMLNEKLLIFTNESWIGLIILTFLPISSRIINTEKIKSTRIKNTIESIAQTRFKQLFSFVLLSFLRYTIFCTQLFLMFHFFNINITISQAIISIPTIYLLSTLTPTIPASEAATRSSYAVFVLAPFCTSAPTIALSTSLLWALNCGLPIILGSFLFYNKKTKH
jgi:hypothetical protein